MNSDPLENVLTPQHREQGFSVTEDEDFVYLYRHEKVVATFSATGASVEEIRKEVDRQLKKDSYRPGRERGWSPNYTLERR